MNIPFEHMSYIFWVLHLLCWSCKSGNSEDSSSWKWVVNSTKWPIALRNVDIWIYVSKLEAFCVCFVPFLNPYPYRETWPLFTCALHHWIQARDNWFLSLSEMRFDFPSNYDGKGQRVESSNPNQPLTRFLHIMSTYTLTHIYIYNIILSIYIYIYTISQCM